MWSVASGSWLRVGPSIGESGPHVVMRVAASLGTASWLSLAQFWAFAPVERMLNSHLVQNEAAQVRNSVPVALGD